MFLFFQDVVNKCHHNPKRIFKLPDQANTYVEIDLEEEWVLPDSTVFSKAKWSPFGGLKVKGAVKRVVLRGEVVYIDGSVSYFIIHGLWLYVMLISYLVVCFQKIIAQPGFGQDVRETVEQTGFSIPHLEFSDLGDPRVTRVTTDSTPVLAGIRGQVGEDDIHSHRHTSETRELYGQMFSELGIPKIRSLSVGPTLPTHRIKNSLSESSGPTNRPVSPGPRSFDSSIMMSPPPAAQQHHFKTLSARPVSPCAPQTPSTFAGASAPQHGLHGQCILTVDMFSKEQLNAIFNLAQTFRLCIQKERSLDHILKVIQLDSLFI